MDFSARQGAFVPGTRDSGTNYGEKKERSMLGKDYHIGEKYNFKYALGANIGYFSRDWMAINTSQPIKIITPPARIG
jgi:hypothetical protein